MVRALNAERRGFWAWRLGGHETMPVGILAVHDAPLHAMGFRVL